MAFWDNLKPLKWSQEFVMIAVILIAFCFIIKFRTQIIILLTGDDKIHMSFLDCCYCTFCRCCNCCDGEWTRYLTSCPCCPSFLYKRNIVKEIAKCLGFYQTTLEIKNIVVGDLPYDRPYGDFYISVSVGTNPDMVTALQEGRHPKVVHFPEVLQLKVRHNIMEPRVHIVVKELNVIGSEHLCEVVLSANAILDWMNDTDAPMKRFQMRPLNTTMELETPPWICLEFSNPSEVRDLDTLMQGDNPFSMDLKVRTWERGALGGTRAASNSTAVGQHYNANEGVKLVDGTRMGEYHLEERTIEKMKGDYRLLDDSGNPLQEPKESSLLYLSRFRCCVVCIFHMCLYLTALAVISYLIFRFYIWSCYRQFRFLTMAIENKQPLPISSSHLHDLVEKCQDKIRGTGVDVGKDPCRPTDDEVQYVCTHLPQEQRPEAGVALAYQWFGANIKGAPCFNGLCKFRNELVKYDTICWCAAGGLVLSILICRCWANWCIKHERKRMQKREGEEMISHAARSTSLPTTPR